MQFQQSEATAAQRRFPVYLVDPADGITPEDGENGGQPQVSENGGAFGNTTNTLVFLAEGFYYVELTAAELSTLGMLTVRFKSVNTVEFNLTGQVVAFDPYAAYALASIATETRLAELDAGNLPSDVDDILEDTGTTLPAQIVVAQDDLDLLTGADGATLASAQGNYAPAKSTDILDDATPFSGADIAEILTDVTGINGDVMRGTENAALASVATEARLSELDAGTGGKMANQVDLIEGDTTANLDAAVSSRAVAGDAMDLAANAIDAAAIGVGAIEADAFAAGAINAAAIAANAIGASEIADGAIDAATFAAGAIDAAAIATDAIDADAIAANAIGASEIAAGAITSSEAPNLDAAISSRAVAGDAMALTAGAVDDVWDEDATGHQGAGTFGETLGDSAATGVTIHARVNQALPAVAPAANGGLPTVDGANLIAGIQGAKNDFDDLNDLDQADILDDATPFSGGDIDAAITTRATQADILGDATPFNGANIDAAISSRSIAGDAMDLIANAVDAGALDISAGQEIADRVLARSLQGGADGGRIVRDALRAIRNRRAVVAGTVTVYEEDDVTPAWTGAVTTAVGNPITEIDPA